jgi:hypothetical protein
MLLVGFGRRETLRLFSGRILYAGNGTPPPSALEKAEERMAEERMAEPDEWPLIITDDFF